MPRLELARSDARSGLLGYLEQSPLGKDWFEMDESQKRYYIYNDDQREMVGYPSLRGKQWFRRTVRATS